MIFLVATVFMAALWVCTSCAESNVASNGDILSLIRELRTEIQDNSRQLNELQREVRNLAKSLEPGQSKHTAIKSCRWLKENYPDSTDGYYWLMLGRSNYTRVYCDQTTAPGGWTMFANLTSKGENISEKYALRHSPAMLGEMENGKNIALNYKALKILKDAIDATQFRVFCKKASVPRTLHISTRNNDEGRKVLGFFTGEVNELPSCVNSFDTLLDDTSQLSRTCPQWNWDRGVWSHEDFKAKLRTLYFHTLYVADTYHVSVMEGYEVCDDKDNEHKEGVWQFFIR